MSNYKRYKESKLNQSVISELEAGAKELPEQLADYMKLADTRFTEICDLYLKCLTIHDLKFMQPEDLICLVPEEQYKHKLLMTVLVRKYLFRDDDMNGELDIVDDINDHNHSHDHSNDHCCKPKHKPQHKPKKYVKESVKEYVKESCSCASCESETSGYSK